MANFKRRKPRTRVRCMICTDNRMGNTKTIWRKQRRQHAQIEKEANEDSK